MSLIRIALSTLPFVAVLSACSDNNDHATLRVVNASPDSPPVDVFLDTTGTPLVAGLAYGQASSYVTVPGNDHTLIVQVSGTQTVLNQTVIPIDDDGRYTIIAAGDVGSTDPASSFRLIAEREGFNSPSSSQVAARLVNASPDSPTLNVDFNADGSVDVPNLVRFGDTAPQGFPLPSSTELQVAVAGDGMTTAFTTPLLPNGTDLFLITIGNVNDLARQPTGFSLLVVGPDGVIATILQNPVVYALQASPDAPALDISLDDVHALTLGFGDLGVVQVPPGDHAITYFVAGTTTVVAGAALAGLEAGQRYLAIGTGLINANNGPRFDTTLYREQFDLTKAPLIRVINSSPDAPVLDFSTVTGNRLNTPPLVAGLNFTQSSPEAGLLVSPSLVVGIAPTRTTAALATFNLNLAPTSRAFTVIAGAVNPIAGEQPLQLLVIDTAVRPWSISSALAN